MSEAENIESRNWELNSFEENVLNSVRNGLHRYYRPEGDGNGEMPFHNIEHAIKTEDKVIEYIQYVRDNGQEVDEFSLRFAALMHDAGHHENIDRLSFKLPYKFSSKEEYAGWLADVLAQSYGVEEERRDKIRRLIISTSSIETPETMEEKILCRADLDNISGPNVSFFVNTLNLVKEAENANSSKNPFDTIAKLQAILEEYLSKDLCLGDFDRELYDHFFRHPALANITRITSLNIHSTIRSLGDMAIRILPSLKRTK